MKAAYGEDAGQQNYRSHARRPLVPRVAHGSRSSTCTLAVLDCSPVHLSVVAVIAVRVRTRQPVDWRHKGGEDIRMRAPGFTLLFLACSAAVSGQTVPSAIYYRPARGRKASGCHDGAAYSQSRPADQWRRLFTGRCGTASHHRYLPRPAGKRKESRSCASGSSRGLECGDVQLSRLVGQPRVVQVCAEPRRCRCRPRLSARAVECDQAGRSTPNVLFSQATAWADG